MKNHSERPNVPMEGGGDILYDVSEELGKYQFCHAFCLTLGWGVIHISFVCIQYTYI
jgi:hypothetical protein